MNEELPKIPVKIQGIWHNCVRGCKAISSEYAKNIFRIGRKIQVLQLYGISELNPQLISDHRLGGNQLRQLDIWIPIGILAASDDTPLVTFDDPVYLREQVNHFIVSQNALLLKDLQPYDAAITFESEFEKLELSDAPETT